MVDIETWSKVANSPNKLAKFWQTEEGKAINDQLTMVKGAVDALLQSGEIKSKGDKAKIDEAIKKVMMGHAKLYVMMMKILMKMINYLNVIFF
jgi:hypothetical protein